MTTTPQAVTLHTGASINGIQTQAEVLMRRHTPEHWPNANAALAQWRHLTMALEAKDIEVPLQAITMNKQTGGFHSVEKPSHGIIPTRTGLGHLVSFIEDIPPSDVANLEWYPPEVRAAMWHYHVQRARNRPVTLRTALVVDGKGGGHRVIRAVVSDRHSQEMGDDLAIIEQVERLPVNILQNAKMRVVKEWDYTHVELVIPNRVREVKKGIVIQGKVNIKNSETKGGSFEASVGTMNLVCLNGMTASGNNTTMSIRHMGDIRARIRASMVTVVDLIDVYLEEFAQAYTQQLPKPRADVIEATLRRYKLPSDTGTALNALWDVDGERSAGHTVAGLANALTRHAQSLPVAKALLIEEVAGQVLAKGLDAF